MKQPLFKIGDYVFYMAKRLKGTITRVFQESDEPGSNYRYYVKCKSYTYSVPEGRLQMQNSSENSPEISSIENSENDYPPAA